MNLRWPSTPINNRAPWYVVVWRLPFIPLAFVALAIFCLLVGLAYGVSYGIATWRDNT